VVAVGSLTIRFVLDGLVELPENPAVEEGAFCDRDNGKLYVRVAAGRPDWQALARAVRDEILPGFGPAVSLAIKAVLAVQSLRDADAELADYPPPRDEVLAEFERAAREQAQEADFPDGADFDGDGYDEPDGEDGYAESDEQDGTADDEGDGHDDADVGDDIGADDVVDDVPTDADDEGNVAGSSDGDAEESDGDEAPDDEKENRRGTGGGGPGGGGGGKGTGERKRQGGGSDTRTRRQTRLRSYVVETDEDEGDRGTVGDEAPDHSPIDRAGVARVLEYERKCGRDPHEMAHSNAGFDVKSYDKRGELARRIEIKSTGSQWSIAGVMVSRRQHQQAVEDGDLFWLYVVENAQDDDFKIYRIQNPARQIDYFGFDGGWKDVAEPDVERDESGTPTVRSTRGLLGQSPGHSPTAG
jgi:hypothetical protein